MVAVAVIVCGVIGLRAAFSQEEKKGEEEKVAKLPKPKEKGKMSLEEAIKKRRCVRKYKDKALELSQLSQLLWAANGVTGKKSYYRAAPSAGALHPLDFYAVVGKDSVTGLDEGVWHYNPEKHSVTLVAKGDKRQELQNASLKQRQVGTAEVVICVTIEYKRTTRKYGDRGKKYAHMDVGFACENLFLQVQTLDLAACVVGAFTDSEVTKVLSLPKKHEPVLLLTIGHPE
jgi:SagB-type dehydrogenase family enzyme